MKKCERCNAEHDGTFGSGRFCSKSCSNSRGPRSEVIKNKISSSLKGTKHESRYIERVTRNCINCNNEFNVMPSSGKKYCSRKCVNDGAKKKLHKTGSGGYRERSGRSYSGYYKGIYCGSTYELVWVIYQIDNQIKFSRFDRELVCPDTGKKYIPDFLQDSKIVEIKGFENYKFVEIKNEIARCNGYEVVLKYKKDLEKEFEWVRDNYSYKDVYELYDDYSPAFVYKCEYCKKEFFRNKEAKTKKVFCSRVCCGKSAANIKENI